MADDYLINDLLDSLDELNGEIDELYTAVVDFLNGLPWWVPDWLVDKVVDKWDEFNTKVTSEMTSFQADINAAGKSYSLRDAADEWTSTISAGLSGLAGTVEGGSWRRTTSSPARPPPSTRRRPPRSSRRRSRPSRSSPT